MTNPREIPCHAGNDGSAGSVKINLAKCLGNSNYSSTFVSGMNRGP